jgi:hypothetical protein
MTRTTVEFPGPSGERIPADMNLPAAGGDPGLVLLHDQLGPGS